MTKMWSRSFVSFLCLVTTVAFATLTATDGHANADNSNLWFDNTLTVTCGNCTVQVSVVAWPNGSGVPSPYQVSVVATDDCSQWYQNNSSSNINLDGYWVSATKIHVVGNSCSSQFHIGIGRP
jgi:hypothetical protein